MIDYRLFETILSKDDDGYIEEGDFIDSKLMELLSSSNQSKVQRLFKKVSVKSNIKGYNCELLCEGCGEKFVRNINKSTLMSILSFRSSRRKFSNKILCDNCLNEQKTREEILEKERQESYPKEKALRTQQYIKLYLDPDKSWVKSIKTYSKLQHLKICDVYWDDIKSYIQEMEYCDFLKTPYWKAISEKVRYKSGYKCQICNGDYKLNIHHRTYENHGDEIHHMEDLICLCKDCHEKYHFE